MAFDVPRISALTQQAGFPTVGENGILEKSGKWENWSEKVKINFNIERKKRKEIGRHVL